MHGYSGSSLPTLSNDFLTILYSRIPPRYSADGSLLLHTMCTHIHRNHTAFVESIKNTIRLTTLHEHKDDVSLFLRSIQDNLRLISSTGDEDSSHNDLLPHIFLQLRATKIPIFQQEVLRWHRQYMEGKMKTTPLKLVQMADEECQILRHSHQWVETIDPSVTALQASLEDRSKQSQNILRQLTAHLGYYQPRQGHPDIHFSARDSASRRTLDGGSFYDAPANLHTPKYFEGRYWYFCTKCGRNGRWVCTHRDDTHREPFDNHRETQNPEKGVQPPGHNGYRDRRSSRSPSSDRSSYVPYKDYERENQYYPKRGTYRERSSRSPYQEHARDGPHRDSSSRSRSPIRDYAVGPYAGSTNRPHRPSRSSSPHPGYGRYGRHYAANGSPQHDGSSHRESGRRRTPTPLTPTTLQGQLSLLDSINAFIGATDE